MAVTKAEIELEITKAINQVEARARQDHKELGTQIAGTLAPLTVTLNGQTQDLLRLSDSVGQAIEGIDALNTRFSTMEDRVYKDDGSLIERLSKLEQASIASGTHDTLARVDATELVKADKVAKTQITLKDMDNKSKVTAGLVALALIVLPKVLDWLATLWTAAAS